MNNFYEVMQRGKKKTLKKRPEKLTSGANIKKVLWVGQGRAFGAEKRQELAVKRKKKPRAFFKKVKSQRA